MKKLSVIIPVYNAEEYIRQCLDSVVNQTYKNLEIILIDDGSTDSSPQICDEYADRHGDVKVLHKNNGGVVSAYIIGIQESSGEYLTFVDSDDWLELNMYEKLMPYFIDDVNMVFCRYDRVYGDRKEPVDFGIKQGYYGRDGVDKFFHKINDNFVSVSRWNKIYLTKEIKELLPMLKEDICFAEDNLFNQLFVMKYLKKAFYVDDILYHYRFNNASVSSKFDKKKLEDLNNVYDLLKKYDETKEYDALIDGFYLEFVQRMFDATLRSDIVKSDQIKLFKLVLEQPNLKMAIANGKWPCYNIKQRVKKFLIKNKMARSYFWLSNLKRG